MCLVMMAYWFRPPSAAAVKLSALPAARTGRWPLQTIPPSDICAEHMAQTGVPGAAVWTPSGRVGPPDASRQQNVPQCAVFSETSCTGCAVVSRGNTVRRDKMRVLFAASAVRGEVGHRHRDRAGRRDQPCRADGHIRIRAAHPLGKRPPIWGYGSVPA